MVTDLGIASAEVDKARPPLRWLLSAKYSIMPAKQSDITMNVTSMGVFIVQGFHPLMVGGLCRASAVIPPLIANYGMLQ